MLTLLFYSDFTVLIRWWQQPEGSHAWIIPFISLFILWRRRFHFFAAATAGSLSGTVVAIFGVALFVFDSAGNLYQAQIPALILTAIGIIASSFGWSAARYAIAPLIFCLFASPPPDTFYVHLSLQLQLFSSAIGTNILHQLGVTAFLDGNIIDLGVYQLHVAEACSGLRYLFPLLALTFLLVWAYPSSLIVKVFFFFIAIPITIFTNSLRIALTGVLVHYFSIGPVEGFMHLLEGWLIFLFALGLLVFFMYALKRCRTSKCETVVLIDFDRIDGKYIRCGSSQITSHESRHPTAALISTASAIAAAAVFYAWFLEKDPIAIERFSFDSFPSQLAQWQGTASSIGTNLEKTIAASDYFLADYVKAGEDNDIVNVWVAYFEHNSRQGVGHTPRGCLPGAGWEFDRLQQKLSAFPNFQGEPFVHMRGIARKDGQRILLYYWIEDGETQFVDNRFFGLAQAYRSVLGRPTDAALVRLVTPLRSDETETKAEKRILDFISLAYPKMESYF